MHLPRRQVLALWVAGWLALIPTGRAEVPQPHRFAASGSVEVAFTPGDAIDRLIIAAIDASQHEVLVHAYSFTDRRIADALVRAHRRGVTVGVLADAEQARALPHNVLPTLAAGGVSVWTDSRFQAAHNKVVIIDADADHAATITGSYNFTFAAQRSNAENIVVLRDNPEVAQAYRANWRQLRAGATAWGK